MSANAPIGDTTYYDYVRALRKLFMIQDVGAWCPAIRSKSAIRSGDKREFVDPSIPIAALGGGTDYFRMDLKTFGFIFETLCMRDLKVYTAACGGRVSYYRDRYGLEAE